MKQKKIIKTKKQKLKKFSIIAIFSFCFVFSVVNIVKADGFIDYNERIKVIGVDASNKSKCASDCPNDPNIKYYQLTTGVPFLGSNAEKCACIPVNDGIAFFLTSILKFILGSVATITTIIIIVAGFMWVFSVGNKNMISSAKSMIKNAITGLVLSLTVGLMLQVVNPKIGISPIVPSVVQINDVNTATSVDYSCQDADYGKTCQTTFNQAGAKLKDGLIAECKKGFQSSDYRCTNKDAVGECKALGQNCSHDNVRGSFGGRNLICRSNFCIYEKCQNVGEACSNYNNDPTNPGYICNVEDSGLFGLNKDGFCATAVSGGAK